jgi:hypothetical protein
MLPLLLLAALALPVAALPADPPLKNADFEAKASKSDPLPGWELSIGARNGADSPQSLCEVDKKEHHGGKGALHFRGDGETRAWHFASQKVEPRPGGKYRLTGFTRGQNVRQEGIQFANCYVALMLFDANGELLARELRQPDKDGKWKAFELELAAPETVREARVSAFLSMTGDLWVDDLVLAVEGGSPLPAASTLLSEDFEAGKDLAGWTRGVGAVNAGGGKESVVEIDGKSGAGGSKHSLRFTGTSKTLTWTDLLREFPCSAGDLIVVRAKARASGVKQEGIQFPNLHLRLLFRDAAGETLGPAKFAAPGDGSYDWKDVDVRGVAPPGSERCAVGLFLSMTGEAWWDDLVVTRQPGNRPAYDGWLSLESRHLLLRYPPDHPRAAEMKDFGEKLDAAFESICAALGIDYGERVTAWLYRDGEEGQRLTGRALAFADPEGRAFHQGPGNSLAHELVHVLALKLGYAQTAALGEGLAAWLDGNGAEWHREQARKLLEAGTLPSVAALFEQFREQKDGYPAAASLCGYLIETWGMPKFVKLYVSTDPRKAAPAVLGTDFAAIEEAWHASLRAG